MGILNVTPDSFSDGGRWLDADAALAQGRRLAADGADIIDVGGESTRPGAQRVSPDEELARILPVIEALASDGLVVSVDTMRAATARAAVEAGARMVNDVSGGLADPDMAATVAALECDMIAMHWRAHSAQMDAADRYDDVVAEVARELADRVAHLTGAGVSPERIIVDPGLGFAKVSESNWPLLAHIDAWSGGFRVLIGASRKRFVGAAITWEGRPETTPEQRDHATAAITALAAREGVWGVRVHDAAAAKDAIAVANAWRNARHGPR